MADDSSASTETHGTAEPAEIVRLASWVTVKRTKRMYGQGAYGTRGILALTDTKLVFLAGGQTQWELERAAIENLKRPRWAIGSYLTFEVNDAFYGLAFGGRGFPHWCREATWRSGSAALPARARVRSETLSPWPAFTARPRSPSGGSTS